MPPATGRCGCATACRRCCPGCAPHAQDLRAEAALDEVAGVLQHGNDADHLRRRQVAGETLPAVVVLQRALWRGSPRVADPCKPSVAPRSPIG